MPKEVTPLRSDMGWSTADRIVVKGLDLPGQIMGHLNLGDFAFLEILGRPPTPAQSVVFNAMLATLVEHGMTPMALVARLTYLGAPESLQGAVAAGLNGVGSAFAGTAEGAARLLQEALPQGADQADDDGALQVQAEQIVLRHVEARLSIPGIGHPLHKPVDPRAVRLFALARAHGLHGRRVELMQRIAAEAERTLGKPGGLPVNATGALGALASELGIPWRLCRGLAVIGRAVGLVGHIAEELRHPLAAAVWQRAEEESSRHARGEVGADAGR